MPLNYRTVHLPLNQGLDTEKHKFAVAPPSLTSANNVVFDEEGALAKRTGSETVSTNVSPSGTVEPLAVTQHNGNPLLFADGGVAELGAQGWVRRRAKYNAENQHHVPTSVSVENLQHTRGSQVMFDQAVNNGYTFTAWYSATDDSIGIEVTDSNGVVVSINASSSILSGTGNTEPRVRAGGDYFHLYYRNGTIYYLRTLDATDPDAGLSSATAVNPLGAANEADVVVGGTTAYLVTNALAGSSYTVWPIAADGTVGTQRAPGRTSNGKLAIDYTTSGGGLVAVAYTDGTDVFVDWLVASTLADADVNNNITSTTSAGSAAPLYNITMAIDGTAAYVFYDQHSLPFGTTAYPHSAGHNWAFVRRTVHGYLSTILDDDILISHYMLASRALRVVDAFGDGRILLNLTFVLTQSITGGTQRTLQPHYLLIDGYKEIGATDDPVGMLAKTIPGEAYAFNTFVSFPGKIDTTGHLPQVYNTTGESYTWPAVYKLRRTDADNAFSDSSTEWAGKQVTYSLNDPNMANGVQVGGSTYIPGGYLAQYDGTAITEAGFLYYPESVLETTSATVGGQLDDGTRSYRFYWEWRNANGEIERSTFGASVSSTLSGGGSTQLARFYVPTLQATNKQNVYLAVYRTEDAGTTFYRCSSTDSSDTSFTLNDRTEAYVLWTDADFSDTNLVDNELDVAFNSEALDRVGADAPQIVSAGQYRIFYVGPEDTSRVRYSLTRDNGEMVGFNEELQIAVPEQGGAIKAVEAGEDALWIFKESAVYVSSGLGPDNSGANGSYSPPQIISNTVGCSEPYSVIRIPQGIIFKSSQGFHLANRGYSVQYIGAGVADFDSETVVGAVEQPGKHRVLFMTSERTLVFDYRLNKWATWDWDGLSVAQCGDVTYWVSSGTVRRSNSSLYKDSGSQYNMSVTTAWIPLNGLAGYGKARRWAVLGEFKDNCAMKVEVGYSRKDPWIDEHIFDFSNTGSTSFTAGQSIKPRRRFRRQKTDAVRFRITDSTYFDGSSNNSVDNTVVINGLSLELGVKKNVATDGQKTDIAASGIGSE